MKLVIQRSRWIRRENNSRLLRGYDNKMCCLGFLGKACGAEDKQLEEYVTPANTYQNGEDIEWPEGVIFKGYNSDLIESIIRVNDSYNLSYNEIESKLIELFCELNIELTFED